MVRKRSDSRVVYFDVDIKFWAERVPSVGAVRPACCPACGAAGAPAGGRLGLVGHGKRRRTVLGPLSATGSAGRVTLWLRRYVCRSCQAVITSAPRGVLRGMLYGAVAIALGLALWIVEGLSGWRVRERVSPSGDSHDARFHGWRSLSRWASGAERWWPRVRVDAKLGRRERARQTVTQLAALAVAPTGPVVALACNGALRG